MKHNKWLLAVLYYVNWSKAVDAYFVMLSLILKEVDA